MKYEKMNREILEAIGGEENIQSVVHCSTRLRFVLKDESKADDKKAEAIDGVLQVVKKGGQLETRYRNYVRNLHVYPTTREKFNEALLQTIQSYGVDLVVLAGCLVVIPEIMVKAYPNKIINIHPALIPSFCGTGYYGLKVHEGVLARGVKVTGATVHFVDEGTDTGPIILQKAVEVKQGDTPEILQRRVMEEAEWKIMPKAIDLIANDKIEIVNGLVKIKE